MSSQVVGADFTAAAQLPNYVNGRLLTAEDLATSQATLRARDARLGRAAGHGVVDGLWVTSSATTLTVAPGLGVAPSGDAVSVSASVTLPLTFAAAATGSPGAKFSCCTPVATGGGAAVSAGCYLLTALPACQLDGQAPLAGTPGSTAPAGCTAQWQVEGVQFKAIALPLPSTVQDVSVTDDNRRNLLAHWCFGSAQLSTLGTDPLGFSPRYSGFDTLDPADLSAADIALAVFYWNGTAVGFVDNWSARRRITAPDPLAAPWSAPVGDQRPPLGQALVTDRLPADGQARLLQFQDQAAEMIAAGTAGNASAATTFPLLPPVGFLPIGIQQVAPMVNRLLDIANTAKTAPPNDQWALFASSHQAVLNGQSLLSAEHLQAFGAKLADRGPEPGFGPTAFFGSAAAWGGFLDWEVADFVLGESWRRGPAASAPPTGEDSAPLIYYAVVQNVLAALKATSGPGLYVMFVKKYTWLPNTKLPFLTSVAFNQ